MMIWFTADTHFGHKKILEYTERPFSSVEEMDEALIENWNSKVSTDDEVYHVGDVGLCSPQKLQKILQRLNGKIYLIRGNHDKAAEVCKDRFEWIKDYYELTMPDSEAYQGRQLIVLLHYAMRVWQASHYGTCHREQCENVRSGFNYQLHRHILNKTRFISLRSHPEIPISVLGFSTSQNRIAPLVIFTDTHMVNYLTIPRLYLLMWG